MEWLEWGGWNGIAGVVALIALVVAGLLAFIEFRAWFLAPPHDVSLEVRLGLDSPRPGMPGQALEYEMRVVGPMVLYEVEVLRNGGGAGPESLGHWPVLEPRDGFIRISTWVADPNAESYFITTWREPTRLGTRIAGARLSWGGDDGSFDRWRRYWWPFWPRQSAGRWVAVQGDRISGLRGMYIPPGWNH